MKILGIIPARGGSKGIKRKNIKVLGNKPLICYAIDAANDSNLLDKTILSSDDDEIIDVAKKYGLEVSFKRPNHLATDESPTIDTIIHVLKHFESKNIHFDAICLLQVTNPFRTGKFIDEAIQKFINSDADSLISVLEVPHEYNPHWTFKDDENGHLKISTGESTIISRRQNLPMTFHRDGSIYITKTDVILNQKSLFGTKISYIISDKKTHVNIDTIEDWKKAENIFKSINF